MLYTEDDWDHHNMKSIKACGLVLNYFRLARHPVWDFIEEFYLYIVQ